MLTIDQLEAFRTIVRSGTFSSAADHMYLTQPAISQRIRNLEHSLGVELFHRDGNKRDLHLTSAGQDVLRFADEVLTMLEQLRVDIKNEGKSRRQETITVAASPMPSRYVVPALVATFDDLHPYIRINVIQSSCDKISALIRAGEADFGILPEGYFDPGFQVVPFFNDHLVFVSPPGYPDPSDPEAWEGSERQLPFLLSTANPTVRKLARQFAASLNLRLDVLAQTSSLDLQKDCVMRGFGLTIMTELSVAAEVRDGLLKIVPVPGIARDLEYCVIYDPGRSLSSAAKSFLDVAQGETWRESLPLAGLT